MEFFASIFIGSLAFVFISAPEKVAGYQFSDLLSVSNFRQHRPINDGNSATLAPAHYQIPPTARPSLYAGTGGIVPSPPPSSLYAGTGGIVPSPPPSSLYAGTGGIVPSPPPSSLYAGTGGIVPSPPPSSLYAGTGGIVPSPPPSSLYAGTGGIVPSPPPSSLYAGTGGIVPSPPPSSLYAGTGGIVPSPPPSSLYAGTGGMVPAPPSSHYGTGGIVPSPPQSRYGSSENELSSYLANQSDDSLENDFKDSAFVMPEGPRSISGAGNAKSPRVSGYVYGYTFKTNKNGDIVQEPIYTNHGPIIPPKPRIVDAWDDGYVIPRTSRENSFAFDNRLPLRETNNIIRPYGGRDRRWNRRPRPRGGHFEELENDYD